MSQIQLWKTQRSFERWISTPNAVLIWLFSEIRNGTSSIVHNRYILSTLMFLLNTAIFFQRWWITQSFVSIVMRIRRNGIGSIEETRMISANKPVFAVLLAI